MRLYVTYIARGLVTGLYKIGRTRNVPGRLRALARAVEPVELLATIPGPGSLEGNLHRHFADLVALDAGRGREWFRDDGAIVAYLEQLPAVRRGRVEFLPPILIRPRRPIDPVTRERLRRCAMADAAARFGGVRRMPFLFPLDAHGVARAA